MPNALVSGFARSFISGQPIPGATITALENEQFKCTTDESGKFGPFEWPIGQAITLVFEKPGSFWSGYKTTQTATLIVPPEGINNPNYLKNISFQVPSNFAYKLLSLTTGIKEQPDTCQIAATITPPNTTMDDIPQGVEGVKVTLTPGDYKPFYFSMFPIVHKTNPCVRTLESTSLDGGVAFTNVPPGEYILEATKDDIPFTKLNITARKGIIVNASPPQGPTMQLEDKENKKKVAHHFDFFKPAAAVAGVAAGVCITKLVLNGR